MSRWRVRRDASTYGFLNADEGYVIGRNEAPLRSRSVRVWVEPIGIDETGIQLIVETDGLVMRTQAARACLRASLIVRLGA